MVAHTPLFAFFLSSYKSRRFVPRIVAKLGPIAQTCPGTLLMKSSAVPRRCPHCGNAVASGTPNINRGDMGIQQSSHQINTSLHRNIYNTITNKHVFRFPQSLA